MFVDMLYRMEIRTYKFRKRLHILAFAATVRFEVWSVWKFNKNFDSPISQTDGRTFMG